MLDGFHALGDDLAPESRRQSQDAFEDGQIVRVVEHVAHETLVDLELLDRQAFEVGQRRVTSAEIVERKLDADLAAGVDDARDAFQILQRAGLEHLHFQVAGFERRVLRERRLQALDKVGVLQLAGADIDADRQLQPALQPRLPVFQRGVDDPFAEFDRQRMVLDQRQEFERR